VNIGESRIILSQEKATKKDEWGRNHIMFLHKYIDADNCLTAKGNICLDSLTKLCVQKQASEKRMKQFDALPQELRDYANEHGLNKALHKDNPVKRDGDT
jgi:hypothetical protein